MSTLEELHLYGAKRVPYSIQIPTRYGQMIVNRFDINQTNMLLKTGAAIDDDEIQMLGKLFDSERLNGTFLDVGACFGTYSLALRQRFKTVYAFEPQRILSNMICGSVALNGIENIHVVNAAVGRESGTISVPKFDYNAVLNFGSIEFGLEQKEKLTQPRQPSTETVPIVSLRQFIYDNDLDVDLIKIDVEGMEFDVIEGAALELATNHPVLYVEWIKSDRKELEGVLRDLGYNKIEICGQNLLCQHEE